MHIRRLDVHHVRVLSDVALRPAPGLNLIDGDNGAGKTSLLEAVFFAGRAQSFRHRDLRQLVSDSADEAHVFVELENMSVPVARLGVGWRRGHVEVRLNGEPLKRRSDLLHALPVQLITAGSHALIERGPDARRRFMDLGLFHVEHGYQRLLSEYGTALRQRNAALRTQAPSARAFDPTLVDLSTQLDGARAAYLAELEPLVQRLLDELGKSWRFGMHYRVGWRGDETLQAALDRHFERDRKVGHTTSGAHRAGLLIEIDGRAAEQHLSRGQQKVLVYALLFAQSELQYRHTERWPVLLIDDLPAELDAESQHRVLEQLAGREAQCLATATTWPSRLTRNATMFHVKHGAVTGPSSD